MDSEANNNNNENDVANAPSIFKLRADEFHGIFDLLRLKDLIAVAKTCTRMQIYAGDFYRSNYKQNVVNFYCHHEIFSKFTPNITMHENDEEQFRFVGNHCKSVTKIDFVCLPLTSVKIAHLKPVMGQIESIRIIDEFGGLSHNFLKMFPNLKRLSLVGDFTTADITGDNNVCLQKYPALEHLEFDLESDILIDGIGTFLEQNPNIRTLAINSDFFLDNQEAFKKSNAKLDNLAIDGNIDSDMATLLNELYQKGFYKRLHLYYPFNSDIHIIINLDGLKKISTVFLTSNDLQRFHHTIWAELEELDLLSTIPSSADGMEKLSKLFVNLKRLNIRICNYNQILPFIRHSNLKKICIHHYNGDPLELKVLNEERKKLMKSEPGKKVNKLIIFMWESSYLKFKWANKEASLDCIELRRRESYEWGYHFSSRY